MGVGGYLTGQLHNTCGPSTVSGPGRFVVQGSGIKFVSFCALYYRVLRVLQVTGRTLAFSSILLIPTRSAILPGATSVHARLAGDVSLGVPVVSTSVSAIARTHLTVTLTRRNNVNFVRGGVSVRRRTRRIHLMGVFRTNIISTPMAIHPSTAVRSIGSRFERWLLGVEWQGPLSL